MSRTATISPDKPDHQDRLLTSRQIAALYGITLETVRSWARDGLLPGVVRLGPDGRTLRFRKSAIDAHIESGAEKGS